MRRVVLRPRRAGLFAPLLLALCAGCSLVKSADDFEIGSTDGGMDADVGPADADADADGMDAGDPDAGDGGRDAGDGGAECTEAGDCPALPHIGVDCSGGECVYGDCHEGYGDCNDMLDDGCEADLGTTDTCGSCATNCASDELCDRTTSPAHCALDCSGTVCGDECVDVTTDPNHCGGCDSPCEIPAGASATCSDSSCDYVCLTDRADCNGEPDDGCEIDTATDASHCGDCDMPCPVAMACASSRCIPEHEWTAAFGDDQRDTVQGVAIDSSDRTLVAGFFRGTVDFGGETRTSEGGTDAYVARYDPGGALDWVLAFGSAGDDAARGVAVDGSDNVYVTGHYRETVDFGDISRTSNGKNDAYVAKIDSSGAFSWVTTFGGSERDSATGIAVDSAGNSYAAGLYESSSMTIGSDTLSAVEVFDGWVAAFGTAGGGRWARSIGAGATQVVSGVALDEGGDLYVAGYFSFRLTLPSGATHDATGSFDAFVASFQTDGTEGWSAPFGEGPNARALGISAGPSGIAVTGWFDGDIDFGGGAMSADGDDGFVASLGFDGAHNWSTHFGGTNGDRAVASAFDSSGNLVVTGFARAPLDFGGGSPTGAGSGDVAVVSYDSGGGHRWSRLFGGSVFDEGRVVATAGTDLALAGHFQGEVDFGEGGRTSEGNFDVFVVRFAQ